MFYWTMVDIELVRRGVRLTDRSIRACRVYFKRHDLKFPGFKTFADNETLIKELDKKYKVTQMNEQTLQVIPISKIRENPNNPRTRIESVEDLKASIKEHGLLCPIAVRWKDGCYEVVAGSRRLRACRELGFKAIPCNVLPQIGDDAAYELATAENIVRENMTAVDEANAVAKLFAQGKSRTEIGAMFGKSPRWAEGRRQIVKLGDKAMEYLAAGKINLGHAEVLTMCNPEDVNKWLDKATWSTPESLKNSIMNEKPLLERAPFDAKKVCKHCEKRSDEQKDLFGDVQCCYCLDRECFENKVKNEAERIRKNYIAEGYEEVPEDDIAEAIGGWGDYINIDTEDEDEKEIINKLLDDKVNPMFWVDKNAEHGLVFKKPEKESDDGDEENVDKDSWEYIMSQLDYPQREKVRNEASSRERSAIRQKIEDLFAHTDNVTRSFILSLLDVEFSTSEDECESYLLHIGESDDESVEFGDKFIGEVCDAVVNDFRGCNDAERKFFDIADRETFEREAYEAIKNEIENPEEEEDNA